MSRACGLAHPALVTTDCFEVLSERYGATSASELFDYQGEWTLPRGEEREALRALNPTV